MKRLDVIWLKRSENERVFIGRSAKESTYVHSGRRLWWSVETTQTAKNLILSANEKFLQSCESHVTGNGDHVPWFRLGCIACQTQNHQLSLLLRFLPVGVLIL